MNVKRPLCFPKDNPERSVCLALRSLGATPSLEDPDAHCLEPASTTVALDLLARHERQHTLGRKSRIADLQTQARVMEKCHRDSVQTLEGEVLLVDHPVIAGFDHRENQHLDVGHDAAITTLQNDATELRQRSLHLLLVRMEGAIEDVRTGMLRSQLS